VLLAKPRRVFNAQLEGSGAERTNRISYIEEPVFVLPERIGAHSEIFKLFTKSLQVVYPDRILNEDPEVSLPFRMVMLQLLDSLGLGPIPSIKNMLFISTFGEFFVEAGDYSAILG
jgi:hypothetical protein